MDAEHIPRRYGSTNIKRKHVPQEYAEVEIHTFDKTSEQTYLVGQVNYENAKQSTWKGWNSLIRDKVTNWSVEFDYIAPVDGLYRIELYYSNYSGELYDIPINIYVDGEKYEMTGSGAYYETGTRLPYQKKLTKGTHHIKYHMKFNCVFLGAIVRRIVTYTGDTQNNGKLTLLNYNAKTTGGATIDECKVTLMYETWMDDKNYHREDLKFNPSSLIFDYRDEINIYGKQSTYDDYNDGTDRFDTNYLNGEKIQLFGGYISSVDVNDNLTEVTINCANRLKDGDIRHLLKEIAIGGGTSEASQYEAGGAILYAPTYREALNQICGSFEYPLKNNIPPSSEEDYADNPTASWLRVDFGKTNNQNIGHYHSNNILKPEFTDSGLYIRNGANTMFQSIILYDANGINTVTKNKLNNRPNFEIKYAMLEPKWEETVETVDGTITGSTVTGASDTTVAGNVRQAALAATNSKNDMQIVIDCAYYIRSVLKVKWTNYRNFVHSASTVLSNRWANCCDGSRLLAEMCAVHGVYINYVHVHGGGRGHVFNRYKGVYIDWLKMYTKNDAGKYVTGFGSLPGRETTYPTKPFG